MRLIRLPDAATIRAWAQASGRPVGSRGAIPTDLYNAYLVAQVSGHLTRFGLAAGKAALTHAPEIARAAANLKARREPVRRERA